jgi:L-threonylcarbamoyladenylate synthase
LLRAFGGPLVGPSANPSGRVSPTTAGHVAEAFPGLLVLDGGPCRTGIESTVIELSPALRILRPGILTADVIGQALGREVEYGDALLGDRRGAARSPGLLPHHYAPRSPAVLVSPDRLGALLASDHPVAVLSQRELDVQPPHRLIRMPSAAAAYAAALYAALRAADAGSPALIAIEDPPEGGAEAELWLAVRDRLLRATRPATWSRAGGAGGASGPH